MTDYVFTRDATTGVVAPDTGVDLSLDGPRTMTLSNARYQAAFDTNEFRTFEVVIARPIEQQYRIDGDTYTFAKTEAELREATWTFDGVPHTLTHPDTGVVRTPDQIHGFHRDPRYVEDYDGEGDALVTDLYVPVTDERALEYIEDTQAVSIGFQNTLDWETDREDVDAIQRDLVADHVASVQQGRCSIADGCGVVDGLNESGYTFDKTPAREARSEYRYETKEGARNAAEELDCADAEEPFHTEERDDGTTIYIPCEDRLTFRNSFEEERGDEFEYDAAIRSLADDISESQREAIKTIREEHEEMDGSDISPNMSTLTSVYQRGAAAWQQSHAPGANQQQWALARVKEFLRDLRNGNALNSGADNDLAPDGYSPPSGSQEPQGDTDSLSESSRQSSEKTTDAVYSSGEEKVESLKEDHLYETESAAREAAADLDCEGVHEHEMDGETMYMPCGSMETLVELTESRCDSDSARQSPDSTDLADNTDCSAGPCSCGLHRSSDGRPSEGDRSGLHTGTENIQTDVEVNGETIDLDVPEAAQNAAQAYLDAKDAGLVPDSCGTGTGTESARMIADNDVTADRVENDIAPYLTSHEEDVSTDSHPSNWSMDEEADTPWKDCGDAQYAAWGWTSLLAWAQRKADAIKRAKGEDTVYSDTAMFTDKTVMDTITYDGTMGGDLDESAIPSDGFEPHYVFDGDTKSESSYPLVDADGNLRRGNVDAAYNLRGHADDEDFLMDVLMEVNDEFDDPPIDFDDDTDSYHTNEEDDSTTMTDDTTEEPTVADLTVDAIAEQNDAVADLTNRVEVLEDKAETLEDEKEELRAELDEYRAAEKEEMVEEITSITSAWDSETLLDLDLDSLEQRLQVAKDAVAGTPTAPEGDEEPETKTSQDDGVLDRRSNDDGRTVSDEHRSWA